MACNFTANKGICGTSLKRYILTDWTALLSSFLETVQASNTVVSTIFSYAYDDDMHIFHNMVRANLTKNEWMVTNSTAASKYIPERPGICINWNPPFQTSFIKLSKTGSYEVNLTSQHSHLEVLLLSKFGP